MPHVLIACLLIALAPAETAPATPQRIIALAPNTAEMICALGECDRLIGVSPYATYPPELGKLPKVGGLRDPDLESILALNPDLLILRGHNDKLEKLCQAGNIRILHDHTDTFASIFATIEQLGELLGVEERAAKLQTDLHDRLNAIAKRAPHNRPTVFLVLRSPDRLANLTTVGKRTYLNEIIDVAGGRNLFADLDVAYPQIALEEVLARDPDIIIEAMPGRDLDNARREQLLDQWRAAGFAEQANSNRIHFLTADFALIPSPRVVLTAEWINDILTARVEHRES